MKQQLASSAIEITMAVGGLCGFGEATRLSSPISSSTLGTSGTVSEQLHHVGDDALSGD